MSVSIANRKYRKYENLIKADPKNEKYKHKMEKYTKMIQTGGTTIPHQMQPSVQQYAQQYVAQQPMQMPMQPPVQQQPTTAGNDEYGLDRLRGNPQTADLVKKIQKIIDYSDRSGMTGGSKKHHNSKSKVKGYRNMIGGNGPFGDMMGEGEDGSIGGGSELESLRMEKRQLEEAYQKLKSLNLSSSQRGGYDQDNLDQRVEERLDAIDGQIAGLTTITKATTGTELTTKIVGNPAELKKMIANYETSMKALRLLPEAQGTFVSK